MQKMVKLFFGLVTASLVLGACAQPAAPTTVGESAAEESSTPAYTDEDVAHAVALAQMEGHLRVSFPIWEAGDYQTAATHAAHPVAELFGIVSDELQAKGADAALKTALDAYATLAAAEGDATVVQTAQQAALAAVQVAEQALVGSLASDVGFQSEIIHGLLEGVEEEYAEAVSEGKIANLIEYHDAYGFYQTAKARYEIIEAAVKAEHANEHEEIEEQFIALETAFPGVTPPDPATSLEVIEEHIHEIVAELREAAGLSEAVEMTTEEVIAAIREKVAGALTEYGEGKTDEAYELAASAYLDGFEHLEGDLLAVDRELVETLEIQFKDLRDGIKAGSVQTDLEALASEINANLDKVAELLK